MWLVTLLFRLDSEVLRNQPPRIHSPLDARKRKMKDYREYNDKLISRWAPVYDVFEIFLSNVRRKIVQEINQTNKLVLDVATGTGSLAIALSSIAKKVVGIDLSSKMLDVACKKRRNNNLSYEKH